MSGVNLRPAAAWPPPFDYRLSEKVRQLETDQTYPQIGTRLVELDAKGYRENKKEFHKYFMQQ